MTKFVVHTDVFARELSPIGFTHSVPKMLADKQVTGVSLKNAYVCTLAICHCVKERKLVCEFESSDEETVRAALAKIGLPLTAILAKRN
jgi:hypothetical protein